MHQERSFHQIVTVNTTDIGVDWTKEIAKKLKPSLPQYNNSDYDSWDEFY